MAYSPLHDNLVSIRQPNWINRGLFLFFSVQVVVQCLCPSSPFWFRRCQRRMRDQEPRQWGAKNTWSPRIWPYSRDDATTGLLGQRIQLLLVLALVQNVSGSRNITVKATIF